MILSRQPHPRSRSPYRPRTTVQRGTYWSWETGSPNRRSAAAPAQLPYQFLFPRLFHPPLRDRGSIRMRRKKGPASIVRRASLRRAPRQNRRTRRDRGRARMGPERSESHSFDCLVECAVAFSNGGASVGCFSTRRSRSYSNYRIARRSVPDRVDSVDERIPRTFLSLPASTLVDNRAAVRQGIRQ
jgi:hypothetical protein